MANPAEAYGKTIKLGSDPREVEATLLIRAASRLQKHRDNWDPRAPDLLPALQYNRQIWSIFASAVTDEKSELPIDIRQNLANLAIFVFKQTINVQTSSDPQKLDSLININRQIAAGLFQKPQPEEPAAATG
ncbi:MAG: flagellar biosynthesis regulator FlaF [Parvibaculaceae bacterium]